MDKFRIERDSLGEKKVPIDALYGIQTLRSKENFEITKTKIHNEMIKSLGQVKKACALANSDLGYIDEEISQPILIACDEIIKGKHKRHFITDAIQGGAGTSINMNANEVIANRALELINAKKGEYNIIHPNDHCNYGQSTNDVIPTAAKITSIKLAKKLQIELKKLIGALYDKANEYSGAIKPGRTHLQDAVPISVGQEFGAFAAVLERDLNRIQDSSFALKEVNIGATAIGTSLNASPEYIKKTVENLRILTKIEIKSAVNMIDQTRNVDGFVWLSSALKTLAVNLSKSSNDLRLMASGPQTGFNEINLPKVQPGSSIMPGKVNPVIPEVVNQVCFKVIGNDFTISKAAEAGQLELNVFGPVMFFSLFQSIEMLTRACKALRKKAIIGLSVNVDKCIHYVENSSGVVTALAPYIGYELCSEIAKEAIKNNTSIRKLILERKLLSELELNKVLDVQKMTNFK